jgi:uncharacterized protein
MKKKRRSQGWFLLLALVAMAVLFYLLPFEKLKEKETRYPPAKIPGKFIVETPSKGLKEGPSPELPAVKEVVIIIDDIGGDLAALHELIKIDAPLPFAFLPYCRHSADAAELLNSKGRDILLHLPMEPQRYPEIKPGAGALFLRMKEGEIKKNLADDLEEVPHAVGVNNHMGSRFMEDGEKVSILFRELRGKGMFFIDSRTTAQSRGREAAIKTGVRFAAREVFIDNGQTYNETYQILMNLLEKKGDHRTTLLIGHPYPSTIQALKDAVPALRAGGIKIIPVSAIAESIPQEIALKDEQKNSLKRR